MKYCEDCKWAKEYGLIFKKYKFAKCLNPEAKKTDGDHYVMRKEGPYASLERQYGNCGPNAKNFEPKP